MEHSRSSLSPPQALAAHWRVFALMAVALGRHVSMMKKMGARGGAAQAELLEAWAYHALVQLSQQIAQHSGNGDLSPEDAEALAYLKTVYTCAALLALLMRQLKNEMRLQTEGWASKTEYAPIWLAALPVSPARPLAFIDTG